MAKIQNISEIHPTLGFTEFDIQEKYRKSFHESELGRLYSVFLFERIAKEVGLSEHRLGRKGIQSLCKNRSYGPESLHRILRQTVGRTS